MRYFTLILTGFLIFLSSHVMAAKVKTKVDFNQPEKFTDFKTRVDNRVKDRAMLMKELTQFITESADEFLDKGNALEITINNIDMAGNFLNLGTENVRTISDSDRIRFEFSYRLLNKKGDVLKQGDARLTNRRPESLKRVRSKYDHSTFPYEMQLFDNWIKTL